MKKNESSQTGRHSQAQTHAHKVALSCHAPEAKAVFVAGTFNDWQPDATPLHNHLPNAKWTYMDLSSLVLFLGLMGCTTEKSSTHTIKP